MPSFGLLDQNEEDNLHAHRLLNIEEKAFRRLTKRLLSAKSPVFTSVAQTETPPLNTTITEQGTAAHERDIEKLDAERKQWREDLLLDFGAFENNIIRVQLLLDANVRERERYATEKIRIQETARAVRENNTQLRGQLKDAQGTMDIRKSYDILADQITNNKALKPRDEQQAAIEKLHQEIAELEREREEYSNTWAERRDQFGRIVEEGMQMLRLIRDEKEEAERKEGMDDMDDDTETSKPATPRPIADGATPLHASADDEPGSGFQRVAEKALGVTPLSTRSTRASSNANDSKRATGDVVMSGNEDVTRHSDGIDHTEVEEGEATDNNEDTPTEKMDIT